MGITVRGSAIGTSMVGVTIDAKSGGTGISGLRKSVAEVRRIVVESPLGWFADICKRLLPREKPGQALSCDTGFELRDCQRYASGEVKNPPGYFIRALLRSRNGWTWLSALMDGCDAPWWIEIQRARRIADAMRDIDRAE